MLRLLTISWHRAAILVRVLLHLPTITEEKRGEGGGEERWEMEEKPALLIERDPPYEDNVHVCTGGC